MVKEKLHRLARKVLQLPDFSPDSQDKIAIRMIIEQGAMGDVKQGRISEAIAKVSNIWASLSGANYGQHEQKKEDLVSVYRQ